MGKPRMIILIRHAQSEGNKNRDIHQSIPDHRVKLTPLGWTQAHAAGLKLRGLLEPSDTIQFFTSPYTRTRETTQGILSTLCSDDPDPSPFPLRNIKVYEEPRLREQDFGNFQPCSAEMERMWQERADYGHFFYRIPNGESAADAYDRVAGFNESLWRQFGEDDCASVCVLVTHGLMSRVFLMKWYHFSVEYFEDLRNVDHCEFLIMRKEESGKYNLQTKLRTWSGLKRERALALEEKAENDAKEGKLSKDTVPLLSSHLAEMVVGPKPGDLAPGDLAPKSPATPSIPKRKKWGGCPNGCDHGRFHYKKENSMHNMKLNGGLASSSPVESPPIRRHFNSHFGSSSDEDEADPRGIPDGAQPAKGKQVERESEQSIDEKLSQTLSKPKAKTNLERNIHKLNLSHPSGSSSPLARSASTITDSSPKNPPQYVTRGGVKSASQRAERATNPATHVGRDFGGTASGRNSCANSDTETDVDAEMARKAEKVLWRQKVRDRREGKEGGYPGMAVNGMGAGVRADGLGDLGGEDGDGEDEGSVCTHESHRLEEGGRERGRSLTEREEREEKAAVVVGMEDNSTPGSVQEVHEAVVDLGIVREASEAAEHSAEEKDLIAVRAVEGKVDGEVGDGAEQETEEERWEKSVEGQVR